MAAGKPWSDHEEMRVRVEQTQREVVPSVELEKKEIKMRGPPPLQSSVPSIVMTRVENGKADDNGKSHDADEIVGITSGFHGDLATSITAEDHGKPHLTEHGDKSVEKSPLLTPSSPKLGSRFTQEESHSIIEKTEDLMEFFEDKKKTQYLVPKRGSSKKKRRTPSPSPVRQSVGLDHLDNLVKLMEQLGSLRDENSRLKNRCDYLESTKTLLIAKSNLDDDDSNVFDSNSLPRTKKQKSKSMKVTSSNGSAMRLMRPRLPSAEDAKCLEIDFQGDSSSDQGPCNKSKLFKRSFSTGSLEVPSDIMEQSEDDMKTQRLRDPFNNKHASGLSKSPESKRKSKFSKWARVKKVLNKQQLSENISSGIKSIKGLGKGAYLRYGSIAGRELTVPAHSVAESRSVDSGVGSGMDGEYQDVRKSTSSNEPPSPTSRFIERHIDVPTPQVDDIEGIWLGPPEWIEKEREKEKEELMLKQIASTLSESPKSEPGDLASPHSVSAYDEEGEKYLQIPIPRRQSSPLLADSPDEDDFPDKDLKRTTSCKEHELSKEFDETFHKSEKVEKKHRTPWGKMKNIIHTRKDSSRRKHHKSGRESDSFGFEEVSETDLEVYDDLKYVHEDYLEGPVSRSTPKASPVVFRQKQRDKSASVSPPSKRKEKTQNIPMTATGTIDVSALLGGVSDEFTRKLQEWEEMKGKRTSSGFKESPEFSESVSYESAGAVSPEFMKKLEEWEKLKSLKSAAAQESKLEPQLEVDTDSSSDETEGVSTPPDKQRQSVNVAEIQLKLSDSFSRKMEEWERQKYRRQTATQESKDPIPQHKSFKERTKSKKTKEEKEREKLEKLREREIMRVEREQQKLEKERMRIEKERLKALEREAKIEKMKGRLSQPDMESKFKNPVLSPLTDYKVTADFARKLHEWEVLKGKDTSTAMYLEAQKRSLQFSLEYQNAHTILNNKAETSATDTDDAQLRKTSSESEDMFLMDESEREEPTQKVKGQKPPPLTLLPCLETPEHSPGGQISDESSLDDRVTDTTGSMTAANIASLEKANIRLLEELRQREMEYNNLQEEVRVLNNRLINFRNEHVLELDLYKKQLIEGHSPEEVTFDTKHMSQTLMHLEDKITELKKFGEQLAMSMEGAAVGKFQTVEGEESINTRLVDLLDKMRLLLQQATLTGENTLEEVSKKSSALYNFEKLYSQAMQLQMQMNNLRLSQLERNKEIMNMKRHLLLQEANNLLLQADVTRREAELLYYKEYSQKRSPIKRWNTYSGKEDRPRTLPVQESSQKESIFQRVQRLRSVRPLLPSTTDSDSDIPTKSPPRRESPRIRKRESPKTRKKESPKPRKRESPLMRRKERESPSMKRKESQKMLTHAIPEVTDERSTDRKEEYVCTSSSSVLPQPAQKSEYKTMVFSTVTLPTAKMVLPKDISPREMSGVPRKSRTTETDLSSEVTTVYGQDESGRARPGQLSKKPEPKFPELLIPEWKKQTDGRKPLPRMPCIEPDDDVFIPDTVSEQMILPAKARVEESMRLMVDRSFDSSETSEDTLKYMTPEPSPAPKPEPPSFPTEIRIMKRTPQEPIETASDPGQSRPNSMIKVSVETHGTPLLLRKPPSGFSGSQRSRINIPVIPLKRIKPAQELLEESQRYRSGHSVYLTRILKRYPIKIECRSRSLEDKRDEKSGDKENVKAGYVKAMVKQLSREGTPDSKGSPKLSIREVSSVTIQRTDSPKSEFVSTIVRKLSSPSESVIDKATAPLRDLTNGVQVHKLKQAFDESGSNGIRDRTYSDKLIVRKNGSQEIPSMDSSSSASTITFTPLGTKPEKPISATSSKVTYSSMPLLSLEEGDVGRERSATTSSSNRSHSYSPKDSPSQRHKIHVAVSMSPGRSRRIIDPSMSPARLRRLMDPASPGRRRRVHEPSPIEIVQEEPAETSVLSVAQSTPSSPDIDIASVSRRSPKTKHKHKSKMGTIQVLCRQSMTLDLGIAMQGSKGEGAEAGAEGVEARSQTLPIRHSTSSTTSASSQSEIEGAVGHSGGEKKKSKHKKFMDSAFIQKSKKFFKVSKENRCPSLECCGSDREMKTV
ncbi:hypothetical protein ACF0H5_000043 [Mactra antiquata]